MTVIISPNPKKEKAFINPNGDIIDRQTKQIITPNVEEKVDIADIQRSMAPREEVETKEMTAKEIQLEINKHEAKIAELQALKAKRIEEMQRELEELSK